MEHVILVDEHDNETGTMEKMQAHIDGRLHRAISVFIFNSRNELLLQQRAEGKYHSPLLWTNTCCSHPRPGEASADAAKRRLREEMGIMCEVREAFTFTYKAHFGNGLTEHEYDHVFTGNTDEIPAPDAAEVAGWKYVSWAELSHDIKSHPDNYTEWFKICLRNFSEKIIPLPV